MSIPDNAELVKIRLAEQRNAKSPELLLHCLLKENRIPRNGNIEKILKEAIRIEKEIDNVLDPLQEISTIIKTKELILKCEKSEKDFLDGKRCPTIRLFLNFGANPEKWCILASAKLLNTKTPKTPKYNQIGKKKTPPIETPESQPIIIFSDSPDSPPPLAEITMQDPEALLAEEICDLNNDFSDDEDFISAVSQTIPETVSPFSSPISPIIERQIKKARKRKARTLPVQNKRTRK